MTVHWYEIAIALLALIGSITEFYGARMLGNHSCRYIKTSYGITLFIVFTYTIVVKIVLDAHAVLQYALLLLLFTITCGSVQRAWAIRSRVKDYPCEH